jgi:hypothetical protein
MRSFLSVAPVARPLPRGLTLWARINLDIPNHAVEGWPGRSAVVQRLWKLMESGDSPLLAPDFVLAVGLYYDLDPTRLPLEKEY